jgi:hypothetical protein
MRNTNYVRSVDHRTSRIDAETAIASKAGRLPVTAQFAFVASVLDRLAPSYEAFCVEIGLLGGRFVASIVDRLWDAALGRGAPDADFDAMRSVMLSSLDDTAGRSTPVLECAATHAARAAACGLDFLSRPDLAHLRRIAGIAREAVYDYVRLAALPLSGIESGSASFDEWLEAAPLVEQERRQQERDLELLRAAELENAVERLKANNRRIGIQPFERGLIRDPG